MNRITKIILVVVMLATLCACFAIPAFAYGGTEVRTDISSSVKTYRINTPRVAIGWNGDSSEAISAGHFIDNGTPWHNDRNYYGNGSIRVTNYRDDPDTYYNLPYLYNYYYSLANHSFDVLTYTLPRSYNWARIHFDVYYSHNENRREYLSLDGNTTSTVVYYNYDIVVYNSESKQSEIHHISENITISGSNIPFCPPSIPTDGVAYNLTITTWNASYNKVTIGTSFADDNFINELSLRTSNELFNDHKANYNPAPTFSAFWSGLWGSIDDFLAIELFPGFTLGTVVYISFAFVALGILLKYFAGG